ncbi:hypothetical protein ASF53_21705 [Methylobacterium sp. Leaf123]|uniref:hemin uptake protein HemP n=1 Tax=Methylobacterium sp. Leaf123 TaxID=1736264 RepID=UPI0006FD33B6|nr:hemin uptake protein HemP [Methylobacterium sp. Leaf123]KQQ25304.1 hypothetical protein ASF53_21705 [Methylobacterium sp. Leaf123]
MPEFTVTDLETRPEDDRRSVPSHRAADPVITSDVLMQGRREIVIVHDGSNYRLRITSNNKLILTK